MMHPSRGLDMSVSEKIRKYLGGYEARHELNALLKAP
jgi:hypothetical protein